MELILFNGLECPECGDVVTVSRELTIILLKRSREFFVPTYWTDPSNLVSVRCTVCEWEDQFDVEEGDEVREELVARYWSDARSLETDG